MKLYELLIGFRNIDPLNLNVGDIIIRKDEKDYPVSADKVKSFSNPDKYLHCIGYVLDPNTVVSITAARKSKYDFSKVHLDWSNANASCRNKSIMGIKGTLPTSEELIHLYESISEGGSMSETLKSAELYNVCNYKTSSLDPKDFWYSMWTKDKVVDPYTPSWVNEYMVYRIDKSGHKVASNKSSRYSVIPFFKLDRP